MLKEQLSNKKQNMKTLLHHRKSLVTFLPEFDMDNAELLKHITIKTKYTTTSSLHFERQSLTMREETRFNIKFVEFLESLSREMGNDSINYMLEYVVRVYNADTYNSEELLFLLLPYRKYGKQILMLGKNMGSVFQEMRKYSIGFICRAIRDDGRYFQRYAAYFKDYDVLGDFIEKTVDEMAMLLQGQECEHIGELYKAMKYLVCGGHETAALRMYQRLRKQMETAECLELLREKFTMEEIDGVKEKNSVDIYAEIHASGRGRELLNCGLPEKGKRINNNTNNRSGNVIATLDGYLEYLEKWGKEETVNGGFTELEMRVLKLVVAENKLEKDLKIKFEINCVEIEKLYCEMKGCLRLTEMLIEKINFEQIYHHADVESVIYIFNNHRLIISDNNISTIEHFQVIVDDLLKEDNYAVVLRNIRRDVFMEFYEVFLLACLRFTAFDSTFFSRFVPEMRKKPGVRSQNIVELAEHTGYNLLAELVEQDWAETAYLGHLLRHACGMDEPHAASIIDCLKARVDCLNSRVNAGPVAGPVAGLVADANVFLVANPFPRLISSFLEWRSDNMKSVEPLVERVVKSLDTGFLLQFLAETQNTVVLVELAGRSESANDLVKQLYEAEQFELLFKLTKRGYTAAVLNYTRDNVFKFVEKYFTHFTDADAIISFLLDTYDDVEDNAETRKKTLSMLLADFIALIRFRNHKQWPLAKVILLESLNKNLQHPSQGYSLCNKNSDPLDIRVILDYVVEHIDNFVDDIDIFEQLVSSVSDISIIKKLATNGSRPAAEFVDIFVTKTTTDLLPVLPFVMPLLLKYASGLKYAKQSLTNIYERYNKLLGPYSAAIVRDCPKFSYLLLHVDPRYSLSAIYKSNNFNDDFNDDFNNDSRHFISSLDNVCENAIDKYNNYTMENNYSTDNHYIISTLESIFNTQTVTSYDCIDKTVHFLSAHLFPSTTYVAFINFFINSFGTAKNDCVKDFLAYLFTNSHNVFLKIFANDFLAKNTYIFSAAAEKALQTLFSQDYEIAIEFFADFYRRYDYPLPIPTLDFAKHVYSFHTNSSCLLISAIFTRDHSIVQSFNEYLEEQFISDSEYALSVLIYLYRNTHTYWINAKSSRKLALLHTEDTNLRVSDLSRSLYNILCQEI